MMEHTFKGTEGEVFYRRWLPPEIPTRIVLLAHGYAEHSGRYDHVARALTGESAAVYAPDHIGHGRSAGERAVITNFDHPADDITALAAIAREEHPLVPVVLVGHSMGALLVARAAQRSREGIAGLAFLGAVLGGWAWLRRALWDEEVMTAPYDIDALSRDSEACRQFEKDPLVYHGPYQRPLLKAEARALERFNEEIDRLTMPVLLLHGADDRLVPPDLPVDAVNRMPSDDKLVRIYPDARHELVNETNRDEVIAELAAFVERVTG